MSPSLLYLKPLRNSNTFLHVIYKSKKKTNLLCILNNVFQYSKIRTRKRNAKKSIKTDKKMESSSFWNPESTVLESGIQYPESGIHSMESRIQDCLGFPYMGRQNCSRRNWRKKVDFASYRRNTENAGKCHIASVKIIFLNNDKLPACFFFSQNNRDL